LSKLFKAAKQLYYKNKISNSNNKIKTTWGITKTNTRKTNS